MCDTSDRVAMRDPEAVGLAAARLWRALSRHPIFDQIDRGECLFEVPFSHRSPDKRSEILRGVIDCVVMGASGDIRVLELKTGRADPSHQLQLDAYVAAAGRLFPGRRVSGILVYPASVGEKTGGPETK
jgi:hypothetical protein